MTTPPRHYLLDAKLEPEGQALLDLIYAHLDEHGEWPERRPLNEAAARQPGSGVRRRARA